MLRRPFFWIVFALVSVGMAGFAYWFFPRAFPIVSLDITMSRDQALAAASGLAAKDHVGPERYRAAASFTLDEEAQTFVELEGGGKAAFARLMTSGLYAPYTWEVRHFQEGEKHEATIRFTPDGRPYGFVERLRQDAPGAALDADAAQTIGEAAARADWGVPLDAFALVERSDEKQPGGRVDHTFVYERPGQRLGEGRYRLRLTVSGDRLTEVTYFIQIPQAFTRRYEHMRSANNAIGAGSTIGMLVLYVLGGIGVGLFVLLRQRWVIWRQPVLWGAFIALLQLAASLNEWPLAWMGYDTALSVQTYALQTIGTMVAAALGLGVLLSLSFMAAESLDRRAFPSHPQLWKMWSREADGSREILGRTAAGYLLVAAFFAYEVALYFMTTRVLGWWTPSEALVHPDVLATYQPWLAAIAPSAQAGFWEESLFRAVPLAGAALIGDRLGGRRWWIVAAMIVQAVVFGAGHAPYPTEPAYARAAELLLPATAFGLLYLRFGLLPSIVLHYTFDVTWFALPVFVSTGAAARVSQALIVVFTLVPLWMVLRGRLRAGRWRPLPDALRNGAWAPPAPAVAAETPVATAPPPVMRPATVRVVAAAGLVALVVWAFARPFQAELPPLTVGRAAAGQAARDALAARGVTLGDGWRVLPAVQEGGEGGDFVWRTAGRARYFSLLGTYVAPPHWRVRVARFEGDLEARAEEWRVDVGPDGRVGRVSHTLPEARPGASLSEPDARALARDAVRERFGLDGASLEDVSADASKRPARMDWDITFKDLSVAPLPEGEPRISVTILGDEVADVRRFVFVPDEWQRRQRADETRSLILRSVGSVLVAGLVFAGAVGAVVSWSRRRFALRFFLLALGVFLGVSIALQINALPGLLANLSTAQPWRLQVLMFVALGLVGVSLLSVMFALVSGAAPRWPSSPPALSRAQAIVVGAAFGAIAAGAMAAAAAIRPADGPIAGNYGAAAGFVPVLGAMLTPLGGVVSRTAILLLVAGGVGRLTRGWTSRRGLALAGLVVLGLFTGGGSARDLWAFAGTGLVTGVLLAVVYVLALRVDVSIVPAAVGTMLALSIVREGLYRAYPGALAGAALGVPLVLLMAWWWTLEVRRASCEP
jgi:hypothetical protein